MESKYFLTVDWCSEGKRGIFYSEDGGAFPSDTQHTEDEMGERRPHAHQRANRIASLPALATGPSVNPRAMPSRTGAWG